MSDLERRLRELGERVSDSVHPSQEMGERVFRRVRTQRMITAATAAVAIVALGLLSFVAIDTLMGPSVRSPVGPPPRETPTPRASPLKDIGLGFPVCDISGFAGVDFLGDRPSGVAWTATKVTDDGRCNRDGRSYFVGADVDGDGMADASWGPFEWCMGCRPVGATDLDGDGDEELVVLTFGGSVSEYLVFAAKETSDDSVDLAPLRVAPPGDPAARVRPGEPLRVLVGGDEGYAAAASCEGYPENPTIVLAWSNHPIEGPGAEITELHITRVVLRDGRFEVTDSVNTEQATDAPLPDEFSQPAKACGLDLDPFG